MTLYLSILFFVPAINTDLRHTKSQARTVVNELAPLKNREIEQAIPPAITVDCFFVKQQK
jgi:hypothetical protein